jgi:hypothetical protein
LAELQAICPGKSLDEAPVACAAISVFSQLLVPILTEWYGAILTFAVAMAFSR